MSWFTPHPAPFDHPPHPASDLACRIGRVFASLLHHLALAAPLLARFAAPAHARLHHAAQRLVSILARLAEGAFPRPRPPRAPDAPKRKGGPPAPYLPRRRAWLGIAGADTRGLASQLSHLLNDPGTQVILAAAPPHARAAFARALRGPARLLGLDLPPLLGPPPPLPRPAPMPRAPRPPRPAPPPYPPGRGIPPNILHAARHYRARFGPGA